MEKKEKKEKMEKKDWMAYPISMVTKYNEGRSK